MITESYADGSRRTVGTADEGEHEHEEAEAAEGVDLDEVLADLAARIRAGELAPEDLPPHLLSAARKMAVERRLPALPPIDWGSVDWERLALAAAAGLKVWAKHRRRRR